MDQDLVSILREIAEQLRKQTEQSAEFQEQVIGELRRMNRTLEKMNDRNTAGPL